MSKMLQVRNVPESLHRRLKSRAALAGKSLSDYVLDELRRVAERPTLEELSARIASRAPVDPGEPAAAAVHAGREEREAELEGTTQPSARRELAGG
jgi:antitoxin FitA